MFVITKVHCVRLLVIDICRVTVTKTYILLLAFCTSPQHAEADLRMGAGSAPPPLPPLPLFLQSLVFRNHFEELQTMLFEAELVINNARLIYVYPNTIEICLTTSYLLFGRHLV